MVFAYDLILHLRTDFAMFFATCAYFVPLNSALLFKLFQDLPNLSEISVV